MTDRRFLTLDDPDGRTRWTVDAGFLTSTWTCIWGRGCQGILDEPAEHLQQGCCSVGARFGDDPEEAMTVAALAATLDPARFQFAAVAEEHGIFADGGQAATRVVDGACIFLNRPGFDGGVGCALHLAAVEEGEDPADYKPGVCGRLPLRVEERTTPDGTVEATLRPWRRDDWGPGGATMAWWCTEAPEAFVGEDEVHVSLRGTLVRLLGDELTNRLVDQLEAVAVAVAVPPEANAGEP